MNDHRQTSSPITSEGAPISEAEALARLRQTSDLSQQYYAAWWVGRMRSRHPDTIPLLQSALRQRQPRDPIAGVEENAVACNAARALGKLGAEARVAIPDLIETLEECDSGLKEASARALGQLGAVEALPAICRRLASGIEGAGAQQPDSPKLKEPCKALLEAVGDLGVDDPGVQDVVKLFIDHPRPVIRSAAARTLLQLSGERQWGEMLLELLNHPLLQVRRSALVDLGATGWRPAYEAISNAMAENSLKLMALRGLVERGEGDPDEETLLNAMDSLL